MWTLTQHGESALVTLTLYDNHRLHITPPPSAERTQIAASAARHLQPGTTATFLVTQVLITEAGAVYYTPDLVPVASTPDVVLPLLPNGAEPDQRLDAPPEHLTQVIWTVIAQVRDGLARARRRDERAAALHRLPPTATTTPGGVRITNNRARKDS